MTPFVRKLSQPTMPGIAALSLFLVFLTALPTPGAADEDFATERLRTMSEYIATQSVLSFSYDSTLEIMTTEQQKIALASSGTAVVARAEGLRATRSGGFANVELVFDGTTVTLLGRDANVYAQVEAPGTIDELVTTLRRDYNLVLPAADLLLSNSYDVLMDGVDDVKDLGSGVIGGNECDHFAFRTTDVDWQIWIAQGERPYPCMYVITTKLMAGSPQFAIRIADWATGDEVAATDFTFDNTTGAQKVDVADLQGVSDLPAHYESGENP